MNRKRATSQRRISKHRRSRGSAISTVTRSGRPGRVHKIEQPLRFQGQFFDEETGLHYNRFRYYDPSIGRYISPDPIGLHGGMNAYAYGVNPVSWTDPLGLCGKCAIVIGENQDRVDAYAKANTGTGGYPYYTVRKPVLPGFRWGAAGYFKGGPKTEEQWQAALKENEKFMDQA